MRHFTALLLLDNNEIEGYFFWKKNFFFTIRGGWTEFSRAREETLFKTSEIFLFFGKLLLTYNKDYASVPRGPIFMREFNFFFLFLFTSFLSRFLPSSFSREIKDFFLLFLPLVTRWKNQERERGGGDYNMFVKKKFNSWRFLRTSIYG